MLVKHKNRLKLDWVAKYFAHYLCALTMSITSTSLAANSAPWLGYDFNGVVCQGGGQGFGPYDYRTATTYQRHIVESFHFYPDIEFLKGGKAGEISPSFNIPVNLDYTLRALPNHHRALLTIIRFQLKANNKVIKEHLITPVECYFQRALNFSKDDPVVYFLYGYYLHKVGRLNKAKEMFEKSLNISPNSVKTQYAYGLLLIDLKQYDEALEFAKKVYEQGDFHPGLRIRLKKLGIWKEDP